jgi:hypothetical protein
VPDSAREEWPRGGDKMYTFLTCHGCHRRAYGSTDAIRRRPPGYLRLSPRGRAGTRCATWRTA